MWMNLDLIKGYAFGEPVGLITAYIHQRPFIEAIARLTSRSRGLLCEDLRAVIA
jgi:hypothetical protein